MPGNVNLDRRSNGETIEQFVSKVYTWHAELVELPRKTRANVLQHLRVLPYSTTRNAWCAVLDKNGEPCHQYAVFPWVFCERHREERNTALDEDWDAENTGWFHFPLCIDWGRIQYKIPDIGTVLYTDHRLPGRYCPREAWDRIRGRDVTTDAPTSSDMTVLRFGWFAKDLRSLAGELRNIDWPTMRREHHQCLLLLHDEPNTAQKEGAEIVQVVSECVPLDGWQRFLVAVDDTVLLASMDYTADPNLRAWYVPSTLLWVQVVEAGEKANNLYAILVPCSQAVVRLTLRCTPEQCSVSRLTDLFVDRVQHHKSKPTTTLSRQPGIFLVR